MISLGKEDMWDRHNSYPFPNIRAEEVLAWFYENPSDESLAEALAQVCNRVSSLLHECDNSEDIWIDYFFYDWAEIEEALVNECQKRLEKNGNLPIVDGWFYRILPFMQEHGYRDGNGWWIKEALFSKEKLQDDD